MNKSESKYFNTAVKMDRALMSLLRQKPFEYVTVSEICKAAGVNRSTFYLHYETIGDLLSETIRYLLDEFLTYFPRESQNVHLKLDTCDLDELVFISEKYLDPYFSYLKDHKEIFATALVNDRLFGLEDIYKRMFERVFSPVLDRFHYPPSIRGYVLMYYLNGMTAIVCEWLKNGCDKTTEELCEIIKICIYGRKGELPLPMG